jgi:transposase
VGAFETLAAKSPHSMAFIDSSIIRAHQHAAGGKKGAKVTQSAVLVLTKYKINALVEENGLPVADVDPGQAHDLRAAPYLLDCLKCRHVVADRGSHADALLALIRGSGAKAHILQPASASCISLSKAHLSPAQSGRAILLKAQTLQARRHPLRQAGAQLHGNRCSRLSTSPDPRL